MLPVHYPTVATVYIVDDDPSVGRTLTPWLHSVGYEARSYASAGEFLLTRPGDRSGCLLLGTDLPAPGGFELFKSLQQRRVNLPVIFLSRGADIPGCVRAMKAGAINFLAKPLLREELLSSVEEALACHRLIEEESCRIGHLQARLYLLTQRELQVLLAVLSGRLNKQIADDLGVALRTVKAHRANVMSKMEAGSLAELLEMAHTLRDAGTMPASDASSPAAKTASRRRQSSSAPAGPLRQGVRAATFP